MPLAFSYARTHTLAYADTGKTASPGGIPVLAMHGMVASIDDSPALFHRLTERGRRVICPARPGYGSSSPYPMRSVGEWGEIVEALADHLGLGPFDVLGISSGAPYAYALARRMPARARRVFILSGIPALYRPEVQALWPYPITPGATLSAMQAVAREVFFSGMGEADLARADARDSMAHDCFGPALDLRLRVMDWGFGLEDVTAPVVMRQSRADGEPAFTLARMTAALLPRCEFQPREADPHFSQSILDDFIDTAMVAG